MKHIKKDSLKLRLREKGLLAEKVNAMVQSLPQNPELHITNNYISLLIYYMYCFRELEPL